MRCKVYPSTKKHSRYVIVPSQKNLDDLPEEANNEIGQSQFWKEIDVDPSRVLIGLNSSKAIKNINSHGYHIEEVLFLFEEKVKRFSGRKK